MRFPYQSYPVRGLEGEPATWVDRPTIPIRLIGSIGEFLSFGLVDTGADQTMLPDRYIEPLGVTIRPGDRANITALGGEALSVRFGLIDLQLGRRGVVHRRSARVGFYAGNKVILGHAGFLDDFTATFNGRKNYLTLTPNGTAPTSMGTP